MVDSDHPFLSYGEVIELQNGGALYESRFQSTKWATTDVTAVEPLTWATCSASQRQEFITAVLVEATNNDDNDKRSTCMDALQILFFLSTNDATTALTTKQLMESGALSTLVTSLPHVVAHHRRHWPLATTSVAAESKTATPLSQLLTTGGVAAYTSLKMIRLYLNIIYAIISSHHNHDTNMISTLLTARCGSMPLITFLFELLPSNVAATPSATPSTDDIKSSMNLNAAMPWKKVILLIRQLVLLLVVPAVNRPKPSPNTPGTAVGVAAAATTSTPPSSSSFTANTNDELLLPRQYGVKARLNDLRAACEDATLRYSPVSFFPGDRFSPPDFTAFSDLPQAVRERLEFLRANIYPRHPTYANPPRRCPPLPLRKLPTTEVTSAAAVAAIAKKSQRNGSGRPSMLFDISSESICEASTTPTMSPFDDPDFFTDPTVGKTNGGTSSALSTATSGTRFSFDRTPPSRTRALSKGSAEKNEEKIIEKEWCAPVIPTPTIVYTQLLAHRGLQTYVTGLMKVLLTAGARTDLYNERLSLDLRHELIIPSLNGELHDKLATIELARHRQIIVDAIAFTLLILLKSYRSNDMVQYNFFRSVLNHRNACVVILKVLSRPLARAYMISSHAFINQPHARTNDDIVASLITAASAERKVASPTTSVATSNSGIMNGNTSTVALDTWCTSSRVVGNGDVPVNSSLHRPIIGYINLIRTLQKLTKRSPAHILMMHHIKAEQVITRILAPTTPGLLRFYAMKLMKSLMRYQSAQWRTDNSGIISDIHSTLRFDVCDDWLTMEKQDKHIYDNYVRQLQTQRGEYESYNANLLSSDTSLTVANNTGGQATDEQMRREYDEWLHTLDAELLEDAIDELQDDSPPSSPKQSSAKEKHAGGINKGNKGQVEKKIAFAEPT